MRNETSSQRLSSYGRFGVLLGLIGIAMAIDTITELSYIYKFWPVLVAVLGIGFIGIYIRRSRSEAVYMGIGVYLLGFSVLALYCSLTSWSTLTSLWPAFIAIMGLSFVAGYFADKRRPAFLLVGMLFISLAVLFYSLFALNQKIWWTIFILAGGSFLAFDRVRRS